MDKTRRPVDDIIANARSRGRAKQGKFSIDGRVAKEKLKAFRLEDPYSFGVELFRAAVLKGATWVEMHAAPTYFWMKFDGRGYTDEEFKTMYDYYFSGEDAGAEKRATGQLALALNASAALGPEQIEIPAYVR